MAVRQTPSGGSTTEDIYTMEIIDTQIITADGTWTKPGGALDTDIVFAYMIGGGGGRGVLTGGSGASGRVVELLSSTLSATETVVIGDGGLSSSTVTQAGGSSSFAGHSVEGGSWNDAVNSSLVGGGSGKWAGGSGGNDTTNFEMHGGDSVFGGGGGGDVGAGSTQGGVSVYAGDGGVSGVAGTIPGGAGGRNAVGARGEVRVYVVRGTYPSIESVLDAVA